MRVIVPILIAAVWTSASVKINGLWPPAGLVESVATISKPIEVPARSMLALLQDGSQGQPRIAPPAAWPTNKGPAVEPRRIALPGIPKPARQPICG